MSFDKLKIKEICELSESEVHRIRDIFFETSTKKEFSSLTSKEAYYNDYCRYFLEQYPQFFFVAFDSNKQVLGYICGCPDILEDEATLNRHAYYSLFFTEISKYRAFFHVNVTSCAQGRGVGRILINKLNAVFVKSGSQFLHIITAASDKNVNFYEKMNFSSVSVKKYKGNNLELMGLEL